MVAAAVSKLRLSIIIPALNEAGCIRSTLKSLQALRANGHEVIVVDGGSHDDTVSLCDSRVDHLLQTLPGRATQMQAGASCATGDVLWFLHADSHIPEHADEKITQSLQAGCADWGRFDIALNDDHPLLKCVAWSMNQRTRMTGIATGDQGMFVRRTLFDKVGGFPAIPLMEDIRMSRILKQHGWPCRVKPTLGTSPRRWRTQGIVRTVLKMWSLRLAYSAGVSPERLARYYYPATCR